MKEGTKNIFSQSMFLGYTLPRIAVLAPKEGQQDGDILYDVFLGIAKGKMPKPGISPPISVFDKDSLIENGNVIAVALKNKYQSGCEYFFNLGLTLAVVCLNKNPIAEDQKAQIIISSIMQSC